MSVLQGDVHDPRQPGPQWTRWRWQRGERVDFTEIMQEGGDA